MKAVLALALLFLAPADALRAVHSRSSAPAPAARVSLAKAPIAASSSVPAAVLALRGGATPQQAFLTFSASYLSIATVLLIMGGDFALKLLKVITLGLVELPTDVLHYQIAIAGWATGKWAAVLSGEEGAKVYCKIGALPLLLWLLLNIKGGASMKDYIMPFVFGAAYIFMGYVSSSE